MKRYKPYTSSIRHAVLINRSLLWKGKPLKSLVTTSKNFGGRNRLGVMTVRHRKSFFCNKKRLLNFYLDPLSFVPGFVKRIEFDPSRSSFIMLVQQLNGVSFYMIAPGQIGINYNINTVHSYFFNVGFFGFLKDIPVGTIIHSVELYRGKGSQLIRSAGCFGQLIKKYDSDYVMIRLSSGERRILSSYCIGVIGTVSNGDFKYINYAKAGRLRLLGHKPVVRGVAMNPVDHPHGGGEGRTSGGRPSVTPWAKITKGQKTVFFRRNSRYILRVK